MKDDKIDLEKYPRRTIRITNTHDVIQQKKKEIKNPIEHEVLTCVCCVTYDVLERIFNEEPC